jgi:hypothetical protein
MTYVCYTSYHKVRLPKYRPPPPLNLAIVSSPCTKGGEGVECQYFQYFGRRQTLDCLLQYNPSTLHTDR